MNKIVKLYIELNYPMCKHNTAVFRVGYGFMEKKTRKQWYKKVLHWAEGQWRKGAVQTGSTRKFYQVGNEIFIHPGQKLHWHETRISFSL